MQSLMAAEAALAANVQPIVLSVSVILIPSVPMERGGVGAEEAVLQLNPMASAVGASEKNNDSI